MKHNKWTVLVSAVLMQLVLGVIYIWGVFQPVVASNYGWSISTAAMVFSVTLAFFVVGCIAGGKLQDMYSPRPVVMVSGIMIGVGTYLASFTTASNPFYMYATYGVVVGIGIGAIYTTTLAVAQKWFPDNKPFATGTVLSALGLGGVIFTPLAQYLLSNFGVPKTFVVLSIIFLSVCFIGGIFMVNPKTEVSAGTKLSGYSNSQMLRCPMYYVVAITMLLSLPAFFMLSPLVKVLSADKGISGAVSTYVVMAFSVLNSAGRFIAPQIAKRVGEKGSILVLNIVTAFASLGLIVATGWMSVVLMCLIAVCFGGFLGIFPGVTTGLFGIKNAASNYGFVLIGYGVSAIFAPSIYEFASKWGGFAPFAIVAVFSIAAMIMSRFINTAQKPVEEDSGIFQLKQN